MPICIPPLRERKEDIPFLAEHFVKFFTEQSKKRVSKITPNALDLLLAYNWPGNVRELRNYIERAVVFCPGEEIIPRDLPEALLRPGSRSGIRLSLRTKKLSEAEETLVSSVLTESKGNLSKAARLLGISRGTLYSKMKKYDLKRE